MPEPMPASYIGMALLSEKPRQSEFKISVVCPPTTPELLCLLRPLERSLRQQLEASRQRRHAARHLLSA